MQFVRLLPPLMLALLSTGALAEGETARRAWLGVYLGEAGEGGVEIVAVVGGGPADAAGVRGGDVLARLGEVAIATADDVSVFLDTARPGTEVPVVLVRDGRSENRVLRLRAAPGTVRIPTFDVDVAGRLRRAALWLRLFDGLSVVEIPDELRLHYHAPQGQGVLVTRVEPGSESARAGLEVGDVIVHVGDRPIRSPGDLRLPIGSLIGETLEVGIVRDGKTTELGIGLEVPEPVAGLGTGPGAATSVRIRLLESELERLERRMREIRAELERLKENP